jgi:hypothetical protein
MRTYEKVKNIITALDIQLGKEEAFKKHHFSESDKSKLRSFCKAFVAKCPCCQLQSRIKPAIQANKFATSTYSLMERISVDTIGPFEGEGYENEEGYKYVVAIIDTFSRYLELFPAKTTQAEEVAEILTQHIGRFGVPLQIASDGGSQFVNNLIAEFVAICGIDHQIATAYSHEEQAIIERSHKETLRHLRNFLYNYFMKEKWAKRLPFIERIHNTQKHESTGLEPFKLVLNGAIDLAKNIFVDNLDSIVAKRPLTSDGKLKDGLGAWAADQLRAQAQLIKIAETNLISRDEKKLKGKDAPIIFNKDGKPRKVPVKKTSTVEEAIEVGSFVLLDLPKGRFEGPSSKFLSWRTGPYRVTGMDGNDITVVDIISDTEKTVNISRVIPFNTDDAFTVPYDTANASKGFFETESITSVEGHVDCKKECRFLIKWKGFDHSHDSYVTHEDFRWNRLCYDWYKSEHAKFLKQVQTINSGLADWGDMDKKLIETETNRYRRILNILEQEIKRFEKDMAKEKSISASDAVIQARIQLAAEDEAKINASKAKAQKGKRKADQKLEVDLKEQPNEDKINPESESRDDISKKEDDKMNLKRKKISNRKYDD